jgi:NAD+ kinase
VARIAILGGSFDPPGCHHRELAERLAGMFDQVIVVPTEVRSDRVHATDTAPVYRAALADISFRGLEKVTVDLSDLENETWTQSWELERRFAKQGEVWFVVPAELVRGGRESPLAQYWERAEEMLENSRFLILQQPNEPLGDDLPRHYELLEVKPFLPAAAIRFRVYNHEPIVDWVLPEVNAYIERHGLYRGVAPSRNSAFRVSRPRFRLYYDAKSELARQAVDKLREFESPDPELIVVIGGDGTMLRAIRQLWRERLPFYGVNTGHIGFLLNDKQVIDDGRIGFWDGDLKLYQLPLLWAEADTLDGERRTGYAFNEVWVERASGQTAWVKLSVNEQERIAKIVCDGVLVSTAAGSTSYARAMGAAPMPFTTPVLIVAGSNVLTPMYWRPAVVPINSTVELTTLDPVKRPLNGYMDGVSLGQISSMSARTSRTAAVELAFQPKHDPAAKLARLQFDMNGG